MEHRFEDVTDRAVDIVPDQGFGDFLGGSGHSGISKQVGFAALISARATGTLRTFLPKMHEEACFLQVGLEAENQASFREQIPANIHPSPDLFPLGANPDEIAVRPVFLQFVPQCTDADA